MSLFSSIQIASNTLKANTIALQVIGQNIANANTPGYIREEVILQPAKSQKYGSLALGLGVQVDAVVQKIDAFLEERLRGSSSDRASAEAQETTYGELESVVGELNDNDISSQMTQFFSSISEILNQPESTAVRNLAMLQGVTLTQTINHVAGQVQQMRSDVNDRIIDMASDVNRLIEQVRKLNIEIASTEGGDVSASDAVGLRDQRLQALRSLAELVSIRCEESASGAVTVYAGGDYLVFDGTSRQVDVVLDNDRGLATASIHIRESDSALPLVSGQLQGLTAARDDALGGFLDQLNSFARTFMNEFNKVFTSGQGMNGYSEITAESAVDDVDVALSEAGLTYSPTSGSFQVIVHNKKTGLSKTTDVPVNLNGISNQTTLADVVDRLNTIDGITASVTSEKKLKIVSDSSDSEFAFNNDTSGLLASLGMATFFSGSSALDMRVTAAIQQDSAKFAASRSGIGTSTENAVILADFADTPLATQGGKSLAMIYEQITGQLTQASSIAKSSAESARVFEETLEGQKTATSGVSLDEEAVRMISFQRSFQASARFISTIQELLDLLVQI